MVSERKGVGWRGEGKADAVHLCVQMKVMQVLKLGLCQALGFSDRKDLLLPIVSSYPSEKWNSPDLTGQTLESMAGCYPPPFSALGCPRHVSFYPWSMLRNTSSCIMHGGHAGFQWIYFFLAFFGQGVRSLMEMSQSDLPDCRLSTLQGIDDHLDILPLEKNKAAQATMDLLGCPGRSPIPKPRHHPGSGRSLQKGIRKITCCLPILFTTVQLLLVLLCLFFHLHCNQASHLHTWEKYHLFLCSQHLVNIVCPFLQLVTSLHTSSFNAL